MPPLSTSARGLRERFAAGFSAFMGYENKPATPAQEKGSVAYADDPRFLWLNEKLKVENDRLTTISDIRHMLDENGVIFGTCQKFVDWASTSDIHFTYIGGSPARTQRVVEALLDRISYSRDRWTYIFNGLFLELFLMRNIELTSGMTAASPDELAVEIAGGGVIGNIQSLTGPYPPESIFRNSNKLDRFDKPMQAFWQAPEPYNDPNIPVQYNQFKTWFSAMEMMHCRWDYRWQKSQRYSRPWLKSLRTGYNRVELSSQDAVFQRHLASTRLLVIYLKQNPGPNNDPGVSDEELKNYVMDFVQRYPQGYNKPGTVDIMSGEHKVESVGGMDFNLAKPADIFMHLDIMAVGLPMHPCLAGFSGGEGGRISGPLLQQLYNILAVNLFKANAWERDEILLPLIYLELALNGIFDTKVEVTFGVPQSIKDIERKINLEELGAGVLSRASYHARHVAPVTGKQWAAEEDEIVAEFNELEPPPTPQSSNAQSAASAASASQGGQ